MAKTFKTGITAEGNISTSGNLISTNSSGDEGGEIRLSKPVTNTTLSLGVVIDVYQNKLRFFEDGGTNRGFYIDITGGGASVGTNLVGGGSGTVTSITASSPLTGGTITTSGTIGINSASANTANYVVQRDGSGNFAANQATLVSQKFGTGTGAPSFNSYSGGVRTILYDNIGAASAGYTVGINSGEFWHTTSDTTGSYKWYGGTTLAATLTGLGALTTVGTITAPTFSGSGASLTNLPAGQLTGTVSGDRGVTSGSTTASFVEYNGTTATAGQFDGGTTAPSGTTRLNYGGYLYATRFYGDGSNLTNLPASSFAGGTLTSGLVLATGTTTLQPLKFVAGTNLTTPVTGVKEYDGTVFYQTSNTNPGRALSTQNYYYVSSSDYIVDFTGSGAVQSVLGATTRGINVSSGTTYEYELSMAVRDQFFVETGITGTYQLTSATVSGSPSVSHISYVDYGSNTTGFTTATTMSSVRTTGNVTFSASISTGSRYSIVKVRGIIRVVGSGVAEIYPGLLTSATNQHTWTVSSGLVFKLTPIGDGTVTTVGTWA
jgi:hypothetical protein